MVVVWEGASNCGGAGRGRRGPRRLGWHKCTQPGAPPNLARAPLLLVQEYPISYISAIYHFCVYCVLILVQYTMISISRNFWDQKLPSSVLNLNSFSFSLPVNPLNQKRPFLVKKRAVINVYSGILLQFLFEKHLKASFVVDKVIPNALVISAGFVLPPGTKAVWVSRKGTCFTATRSVSYD